MLRLPGKNILLTAGEPVWKVIHVEPLGAVSEFCFVAVVANLIVGIYTAFDNGYAVDFGVAVCANW